MQPGERIGRPRGHRRRRRRGAGPASARRGAESGPTEAEEEDAEPPRVVIPDGGLDAQPPPLGASPDGSYLRVFLTSGTAPGTLGGHAQADVACTAYATDAGLGGTWRAWIASDVVPASARVTGNGPFVLLNGTVVASSRGKLLSGALSAKIDRNEKNLAMTGHIHVWTGAETTGAPAADTCAGWRDGGARGQVGYNITNSNWTAHLSAACAVSNRLYCFEQ